MLALLLVSAPATWNREIPRRASLSGSTVTSSSLPYGACYVRVGHAVHLRNGREDAAIHNALQP